MLIAQYYLAATPQLQRAFLHTLPLARGAPLDGYFASWLHRQTPTLQQWADGRHEYADALQFLDAVDVYFRDEPPAASKNDSH